MTVDDLRQPHPDQERIDHESARILLASAVMEEMTASVPNAVAQDRPVTFRNAGGTPKQDAEHVRAMIRAAATQSSWAAVAEAAHLPKRTVWAFAMRGYNPKSVRARRALGLPVDPIPQADIRLCACGCAQAFYPATWNQKRIHGHPRRRN